MCKKNASIIWKVNLMDLKFIYKKKQIYLRSVQCFPFHPCEQTHVPFLHWPCSAQRVSHGNWSQRFPVHPTLHRHLPDSHTPFEPQSRLQTSTNMCPASNNICDREGYIKKKYVYISILASTNKLHVFIQLYMYMVGPYVTLWCVIGVLVFNCNLSRILFVAWLFLYLWCIENK